jgi:hypothetical protein
MGQGQAVSKLHIEYVRSAIDERYTDLLDLSDLPNSTMQSRHQAFLSRGLAALAVQSEHQVGPRAAAACVFDGADDRGLDAVSVELRTPQPRICVVQAKWSDLGKGGFDEEAVHKLFRGLDLLFDRAYSKFNSRFQPLVPSLQQAFDQGLPKVTIVLALMRTAPLDRNVRDLLEEKIAAQNVVDEIVDYKVLDLRDFHRAVLGDAATPRIDATIRLDGFAQESTPYKALYGTMTVPDLADLYGEHKRGLFARNIRDALDLTEVNVKIQNTLLEQPEHFWYFSNGITMLCETIKPVGRVVPGRSGDFKLTGISVVNGAQTVSALHRAFAKDPDTAQVGRVTVRLISLEDCPEGFGEQVTITTNTQNPIEERDFKSLDQGQIRLRDDFALLLHRSYVIKRGERVPDPHYGCSMAEAAEALAAVHPDAQLAAVAKRDQNLAGLWEDTVYEQVFGTDPNAYRVWRSVELLRAVRAQLKALRDGLLYRADAAASHGDLLVAHIVYRRLHTTAIENPDFDWPGELARVPQLVRDAFAWVLRAIDDEYGKTSLIIAAVRNDERIQRVVRAAMRGLDSGTSAPTLQNDYQVAGTEQRGRQTNAVITLIKARRVPEGTHLEFRPFSQPERREMTDWLAVNPDRARAIWSNTNGNRTPLQWAVDGEWYSPSGLSRKMRAEASGVDTASQGTVRWFVPEQGSLEELAYEVRQSEGTDTETGPFGQ